MVTLLGLPDELICHVLSKVAANKDCKGRLSPLATGHHDIVGFALTCHRAWTLSEQFFYSAVLLRKAKEVTTLGHCYWTDESSPLPTNQARGRHLKDLAVVPSEYGSRESNEEFLKLSKIISSMAAGQLARLHIELPYHQTSNSQFWFRFRSTFGKSIPGHIGGFFTLPWASRLGHCKCCHRIPHPVICIGSVCYVQNLISRILSWCANRLCLKVTSTFRMTAVALPPWTILSLSFPPLDSSHWSSSVSILHLTYSTGPRLMLMDLPKEVHLLSDCRSTSVKSRQKHLRYYSLCLGP